MDDKLPGFTLDRDKKGDEETISLHVDGMTAEFVVDLKHDKGAVLAGVLYKDIDAHGTPNARREANMRYLIALHLGVSDDEVQVAMNPGEIVVTVRGFSFIIKA